MTNIMIVTHGSLAVALKVSAKMFFGDIDDVKTIGLFPGESLEDLKAKVEQELALMGSDNETLVFVDMLAGSPFNAIAMIMAENEDKYHLECYTGVNMPLLMEALAMRGTSTLEEIVKHLNSISKDTIVNLKERL